jgi:shikimate dehydrogenase
MMRAREMATTASTGLVGIIGHPIRHSLSPRIHNAAFAAQGVDLVYLAFDVPPERLGEAVHGIRALGMRGVNVTVPHKETVLAFLDEVDPLAARVGAVNTVVNDRGRLVGYNTDVTGFTKALRSILPDGARGLTCIVFGAGGAARAVLASLVADGAANIFVHNRTFVRAANLCNSAAAWGTTECSAISEERLRQVAPEADLVVNATSVGLASQVKDFPVLVDTLQGDHLVVDLVYGQGPTRLVEAAQARGGRAMDGIEMLVMQAGCSYSLWTGLEPPTIVMRESVQLGER